MEGTEGEERREERREGEERKERRGERREVRGEKEGGERIGEERRERRGEGRESCFFREGNNNALVTLSNSIRPSPWAGSKVHLGPAGIPGFRPQSREKKTERGEKKGNPY